MKWPWHNEGKKGATGLNQSGNILFVLFGAVAIAGTIGGATTVLMKGPVKNMSQLNQSTLTQTQIATASRMLMLDVANLTTADCDGDRLNEPREWKNAAGAGPDGVAGSNGGGFIPDSIGASKRDTWGTSYGYCVWDHGAAVKVDSCGGTTSKRLQGANSTSLPVIAIISAGKDKTFQTPCRNFSTADVNTNGKLGDAGDLTLITPSGDDMVSIYSYAQANEENPNLWQLTMDEDGEVVAQMDPSVKSVTFSGQSAAFNGQFKMTGSKGLMIPDQATMPTCAVGNVGNVRRNTSSDPVTLELCVDNSGVYAWEELANGGVGSGGGGAGNLAIGSPKPTPTSNDFREVKKITASDGQAGDAFGESIALTATHAIISARKDDDNGSDSGSIYTFDLSTGAQLLKIKPTDGAVGDYFGGHMAAYGDFVLVASERKDDGAADAGAVYLFNYKSGTLIKKFVAPVALPGELFGTSLAMNNRYILIGGWYAKAYLYDAKTFALIKEYTEPTAGADYAGSGVALTGDYVLIGDGASDIGGITNSGAIYAYNAKTGQLLHTMSHTGGSTDDWLGYVLRADGNRVSAQIADDVGGVDSGAVITFDVTTGAQIAKLKASPTYAGVWFGYGNALSGGYTFVGASGDGGGGGAAFVYSAANTQTKRMVHSDWASSDNFGWGIDAYGNYLYIGAHNDDDKGTDSGSVYIFVAGEHHGGRVNVTQTANDNDTLGNIGWSSTLASDTALDETGIAFGIAPTVDSTMVPTAAITAVREANPGSAGMAFKFNDGTGKVSTGLYLGTNERLRFSPANGDSALIYAGLQIGDHGGASWNTAGYGDGLLITSSTGGTDLPVYFGYQNDSTLSEVGTGILYPNNFEIGRFALATPGTVLPVFNIGAAEGRLSGNIDQYATSGSTSQMIGGYSATHDFDGRVLFSRMRGGPAFNTLPNNGDTIGSILYRGYDGSAYPGAAQVQIKGIVNGTVSTGNIPVDIVIGLSATGAADSNEALRITSAGLVGINKTAPEAMLHVGGRIIADNGLRIGNDTTCSTAADTNTLRYTGSGNFDICYGGAWVPLGTTPPPTTSVCSPAPFDFIDISNAPTSTVMSSNKIIIGGLSSSCYMTVASARPVVINLNGADQASKVVAVANGDVVYLKMTSNAAQTQADLFYASIGDKTDDITIRTLEGCSGVGMVCADGTPYAGLSPDGNIRMFTTRCDAGMYWNGSACAGTRVALTWSDCAATALDTANTNVTNANITGGAAVATTGWAHTQSLVPLDSCSTTGAQAHTAAAYCYNLVSNGKSDWYLPSQLELGVLYTNRASISIDTTATGIYWSSSENSAANAYVWIFNSATNTTTRAKASTLTYVRCVRKGAL